MAAPLELEEAQARLLALAAPLAVERVDIGSALGRWLAEPLIARRTQPAADLSAMDGYAVTAGDLAGPWRLIGTSAAGHPFPGRVAAGQAVRIATGGLLPQGAGAVVVQEDMARDGELLSLTGEGPDPPVRHIRRAGCDFAQGDPLLPAGTRIGPAQLALALAAGHTHLAVRRSAQVAILDSGDELAPAPDRCAAHQVPASNGAMLAALVSALPCTVLRIGPVADDRDALVAALEAAKAADVIVTSGGASVGDRDLIRPALEAWGAKIEFWKIAIKPGKPLLVATKGSQLVLGLPGNPVSSLVTAYLFLLPLLRRLGGAETTFPRRLAAKLTAPLPAGGDRREFLRGAWDGAQVVPQRAQDSGAMASLARSNVLIDRPRAAPASAVGEPVTIYLLENGGIA